MAAPRPAWFGLDASAGAYWQDSDACGANTTVYGCYGQWFTSTAGYLYSGVRCGDVLHAEGCE